MTTGPKRGRPPARQTATGEPLKTSTLAPFTIRPDQETRALIDAIGAVLGFDRTRVVERAVKALLDTLDKTDRELVERVRRRRERTVL